MLFQNIAALVLQGVRLNIEIVAADAGKLEVNVLPTSETGKTGLGLVGKCFVATPQELDAEFADVMASFTAGNLTLKEQLAQAEAEIAATAAKAAEAKVATAVTKPQSRPAPAKRPAPTLNVGEGGEGEPAETGQASTEVEPVAFSL